MAISARRSWIVVGQAAVSLGLLAYLLWDIPFASLYQVAAGASVPLVLAGMVATVVAHWLDSVQMMWALTRQKIAAGSGTVLRINLISMFYSLFLPTMIAGGAIRWYHFSRLENKPTEALAAILFNRVFETLLLVSIGMVALLADLRTKVDIDIGLILLLAVILALGTYLIAFNRRVHLWMNRLLCHKAVPATARSAARRLLEALERFDRLDAAFQVRLFSLGLFRQLVAAGLIMVFVRALDIDIGFATVAWIRSLVAVLTLMPFSIAGLGIREATFVVVLAEFGVSAERALLLSLLLFARTVVYGLIGGLFEARRVFVPDQGSVEVRP